MPLRALEDALHAQVSDAVLQQEQMQSALEAKGLHDEEAAHVEHVPMDEHFKETK